MDSIKTLLVSLLGGDPDRHGSAKLRVRSGPVCETLEGRQLLSGAGAAPVPVAIPAPHVLPGPILSAAALDDLKALQADTQALQAEIKAKVPGSLLDALKNDATAIQKAMRSSARNWTGSHTDRKGFLTGTDPSVGVLRGVPGFPGIAPGANVPMTGAVLPAEVVTKLEAVGVSKPLIAQFEADARSLQAAIQKVDPGLVTRIETGRQKFEKDAPPPGIHFDHIKATAPK